MTIIDIEEELNQSVDPLKMKSFTKQKLCLNLCGIRNFYLHKQKLCLNLRGIRNFYVHKQKLCLNLNLCGIRNFYVHKREKNRGMKFSAILLKFHFEK